MVPSLVGQFLIALNSELHFRLGSNCFRLSTSYADPIFPVGDKSISFLIYLTQVARIQREVDMLSLSSTHSQPRKSTQSPNWSRWRFWET